MWVLLIIAVISVCWAWYSLTTIEKGIARKEQEHTKKDLKKHRVIFQASDSSSSS